MLKIPLLPTITLVAMSSALNGAVIASYVDGTDAPDNAIPAISTAAGVSGSNLVNTADANNPIREDFGTATFGSQFILALNGSGRATAPSASTPPTTSFIGFTITADPGSTIDANSASFEWGYAADIDAGAATYGYQLFANVDGSSWAEISSDQLSIAGITDGDFVTNSALVDLSSLGETVDGGNVEFRFVPYVSSGEGGVAATLSNIVIDTDPVPEPSSLALLALGAAAGLRRRR